MITILRKSKNKKKKNFFNSFLGNIQFFFIDKELILQEGVKFYKENNKLFFKTSQGELSLTFIDYVHFFIKKKKLLISINNEKKKMILNLYIKLIKLKIKGVLQGFKINLILKGIGFKASIENNKLILKLGFSHNVTILIPENVKIINNINSLIFNSMDYIFLSQFVHMIKKYKKPEPYKGKGLLLKNEKILQKEVKKTKK